MPYLMDRYINAGLGAQKKVVPNGFLPEARKFYYDTAQVPSRPTMLALRNVVPVSQILYGTDYPYRTLEWTTDRLRDGKVFDAAELRAVDRDNARRLFPSERLPLSIYG